MPLFGPAGFPAASQETRIGPEACRGPVEEQPHTRRKLAVGRIEQGHRRRWNGVIGEQPHKASCIKIALNVEQGKLAQSQSEQDRAAEGFRACYDKAGWNVDLGSCAGLHKFEWRLATAAHRPNSRKLSSGHQHECQHNLECKNCPKQK